MTLTTDFRLVELKVLANLADRTWDVGISTGNAAGQTTALGITQHLYADLILTLIEDGYLLDDGSGDEMLRLLQIYERNKYLRHRKNLIMFLCGSSTYRPMIVTYRGLRRIDELRDQLRRDRVLESFGILLDGRYLVSDLIRLLDQTNNDALSLLFADVDNFGKFNKTHGHKAGDAVLRNVFLIFKQMVDGHGEVYRRGGEEIVVLLPHCELSRAKVLAENIRDKVERTPISYENKKLHTTLSIGVAASPPCNSDGPALEAGAETMMKRAKRRGKNRVLAIA